MKKIITAFFIFFAIDIFSAMAYFFSPNSIFLFTIICAAVLFVTLYRLEYGVAVAFGELFIGGKGYLFSFSLENVSISIRMAIFCALIIGWIIKKVVVIRRNDFSDVFSKKNLIFYAFCIFIIYGIINGLLHNTARDVYYDANGWLYFLLIFPVMDVIKNEKIFLNIIDILYASIIWTSIKTAAILMLFSRGFVSVGDSFYKWIRDTGVGEITLLDEGFYRIFFQSHIFALIALFLLLVYFVLGETLGKKKKVLYGIIFYCSIFILLVSQSRSFWIGGIAGLLTFVFFMKLRWKIKWKNLTLPIAGMCIAIISQIFLIQAISGYYGNMFSKRTSQLSDDAGGISRISQLRPLFSEIQKHPFLGSGFGTSATYKSSDPRILEKNPDGLYTTFTFEWGYLDAILKIGILGLISYLIFIYSTARDLLRSLEPTRIGLFFGLIALAITNIFSPYLNHPLGIGYVLLLYIFSQKQSPLHGRERLG